MKQAAFIGNNERSLSKTARYKPTLSKIPSVDISIDPQVKRKIPQLEVMKRDTDRTMRSQLRSSMTEILPTSLTTSKDHLKSLREKLIFKLDNILTLIA